jgi:hypothetical protein
MSASSRSIDVIRVTRLVRLVPDEAHAPLQIAELFDHLVGERLQSGRHGQAKLFRSLEVDNKLVS